MVFGSREENRGMELDGKIVGIIGYGNMGKSFAKKLRGFDCEVLCYDIKNEVGDENAKQVSLDEFQKRVDVVSLHTRTRLLPTVNSQLINADFIKQFQTFLVNKYRKREKCRYQRFSNCNKKRCYFRSWTRCIEFEKSSFESLFEYDLPLELSELLTLMDQVILSPHVAGWTIESKKKLAKVIVNKIINNFNGNQYE